MSGFRLKSAFLLFNFDGSREITDKISDQDMDDLESHPNVQLIVSRYELNRIFLFSQMTVIDDVTNVEKYHQLAYIEYLEMLCRAALKLELVQSSEPKRRVEYLLQLLLDRMKKHNVH